MPLDRSVSTPSDLPATFGRLLKPSQVAQVLQQPRSSVYALIRSGQLTAINIAPGKGKVLRVRERDLEAFIESRLGAEGAGGG